MTIFVVLHLLCGGKVLYLGVSKKQGVFRELEYVGEEVKKPWDCF